MSLKNPIFALVLFFSNTIIFCAEKQKLDSEPVRITIYKQPIYSCSSYLTCFNFYNKCLPSKREEITVDLPKNENAYSAIRKFLVNTCRYDVTLIKLKYKPCVCCVTWSKEIPENENLKIGDLPSTTWVEFWILQQ